MTVAYHNKNIQGIDHKNKYYEKAIYNDHDCFDGAGRLLW